MVDHVLLLSESFAARLARQGLAAGTRALEPRQQAHEQAEAAELIALLGTPCR
jgi:hypothetical protein